MMSARLMKLGIFVLIFFGFTIADTANGASANSTADIVYSARYYKPGAQPSHYKIWRINSDGSGRLQVTSGSTEDHSPIWLTDGKTILFVRETAKKYTLCTVAESGGHVTELAILPKGYLFIESVAPNRRSLVYLMNDPRGKLVLFDVATRQEQVLVAGYKTAWSPDSRRLYIAMDAESKTQARILDLTTMGPVLLPGYLIVGVWLNDNTLVVHKSVQDSEQARLIVLHADGTKKREVLLPFTWEDEDESLSPFADNLFAIPGDPVGILYGRHAGCSSGPAQRFYRVSLKGGQPTVVANGRDLAWSSDHQFFVTGGGPDLTLLDRKRKVWVSPLSVVSLATGEVHTIVQGLVDVREFDWRPQPEKVSKVFVKENYGRNERRVILKKQIG